jgi:hypothetical protein
VDRTCRLTLQTLLQRPLGHRSERFRLRRVRITAKPRADVSDRAALRLSMAAFGQVPTAPPPFARIRHEYILHRMWSRTVDLTCMLGGEETGRCADPLRLGQSQNCHSMVHGRGQRALGHEADVCSFDRDPDIYGIRALKSCRARQCHSTAWPRSRPGCSGSGSKGRRLRVNELAAGSPLRAGAGRVLQTQGKAESEIPLRRPARSRRWLKMALVECIGCHQVVDRRSPVQRYCPDCRADLGRARSRGAMRRTRGRL